MKVAPVITVALILCIAFPCQIQAKKKPKPKFCVGNDGNQYAVGEGYDDNDGKACVHYKCVKKKKKLVMKKGKCVEDGEWSSWSSWSACSSTCGSATKTRERTCSSPAPSNGGNPCSGPEEQIEECSNPSCVPDVNMELNFQSLNGSMQALQTTMLSVLELMATMQSTVDKQGTCMSDLSSSDCPNSAPGKVGVVAHINTIKAGISTNKAVINTNKAGINTNKADINTNKEDINTNKAGIMENKAAIADHHGHGGSQSIYFIASEQDIVLYHPTDKNLDCAITPPSLIHKMRFNTNFYFDNTIHLCGGLYAQSKCISYNREMNGWKTHTLSPSRYDGGSSVVLKNTLYLIGGYTIQPNFNTPVGGVSTPLPLANEPVLTSVPNLSYKGYGQRATKVDEDTLAITGGKANGYISTGTLYNTKTSTETSLPPLQQIRKAHGFVMLEKDNKKWLIVAGGSTGHRDQESTEMLELGGNSWTYIGNLNVKRHGLGMIVTQRGVMVMGGFKSGLLSNGAGVQTSVELLDWATKQWSEVQPSLQKAKFNFGEVLEIPASMFNCHSCSEGWKSFGGHCYRLFMQTFATYVSAETKCQNYEAGLMSLESEDENDFVEDMLNEADTGTDIWLSAKRPNTGSPFTWKTGSSLTYTNWQAGQPGTHGDGIALCTQMLRNGGNGLSWAWRVTNCDGGDIDNAVVCERKKQG